MRTQPPTVLRESPPAAPAATRMGTIIRPSTPGDAPRLVELLAEVFGLAPNAPIFEPAFLYWKYWQPRADWRGARSFVLARGDAILAHAGLVPGVCAWERQRLRTLHLVDWAARPGAMGGGLALLKHIRRLGEALLAIGGSEHTMGIMAALGSRSYGTAARFVRPLRPLRRLIGAPRWTWRLVPQVARSAAWAVAAPSPDVAPNWELRRVPNPIPDACLPPLPSPRPGMAVMERSAAILCHALGCPTARMALHLVQRDGRVRGYCLLAFLPGQARIVDCWIDAPDPEQWRALIHLTVRLARREESEAELVAVASDPLFASCLGACGFHPRRTMPVQLLTSGSQIPPEFALRVQLIDDDEAYYRVDRNSFWA